MLKQGATFLDLKGNGIWADNHPEMRGDYNAQDVERGFVQNARTLYNLSKHLPQKGLWGLATDHEGDTIYVYVSDPKYRLPDEMPFVRVPPGGPRSGRPVEYLVMNEPRSHEKFKQAAKLYGLANSQWFFLYPGVDDTLEGQGTPGVMTKTVIKDLGWNRPKAAVRRTGKPRLTR
jgi:hypothetical protein